MKKKKREKAEDFIGWKSEDGKLEVIGIHEKSQNGRPVTFKVTCTECSKDKELFPDGYFVSRKGNLVNGQKPCGCSTYKWEDWQFLILAHREGEEKGFVVHGFAEQFKNAHTKLNLRCLKYEHNWTASIDSVINSDSSCPKCAGNAKLTEQEALQKCIDICRELNYDVIGFVEGYKNTKTRFEYTCKTHGKQEVNYNNFVNKGVRCGGCAVSGYSSNKQGSFYVYKWAKDNHSFIKFGITNQKELARIKKQKHETRYNYEKVWSATFEDGSIPLYIENYIKNSGIEICIMSKEEFPDGFTETVCIEDIDYLENLIVEAFCTHGTEKYKT